MSLTSRISVTLTADQTNPLDHGTPTFQLVKKIVQDFANGTGLNQASKLFSDTRTIAPSTTEDLDLNGGGLVDALGNVLVFAKINALIIRAHPANVNNLTLLGDANSVPILGTAATTSPLKPGGIFVYADPSSAGVVVTAGTGDIIQVANAGAGTSVTYDIFILGS